ncbi:MAG TPA: hypothetical protein VL689_04140 [Paraburkholderia sp.]|jgi:hypothetical protein|nr:hypothetical protein [Paraburkholderia sp.]
MTVPSRILIALAFALFLLRGAFACEPAQPVAPAASHVAVRAASREAACTMSMDEHGQSSSRDAGCCVACSTHCSLLPAAFSFNARGPRNAAPWAVVEPLRAGIVRAPLVPPPIV